MGFSYHVPVLCQAVAHYLITDKNGTYLDGTLGGGGHAAYLLPLLGDNAHYIGIDQDPEAIDFSRERLGKSGNVSFIKTNFSHLVEVVEESNLGLLSGILLDLGVSSFQIDEERRGFSFSKTAKLDMRMDASQALTAGDLINSYSESELTDIFRRYGEERHARKIAGRILMKRKSEPVSDSLQLRKIIDEVTPGRFVLKTYARIFQALRIAVNNELENLKKVLSDVVGVLKPGGHLVVISYHSLEDRIVKTFLRRQADPCVCPSELPQCVCGLSPAMKILTRRPIRPGEKEISENSRSRSARLRAGEKL